MKFKEAVSKVRSLFYFIDAIYCSNRYAVIVYRARRAEAKRQKIGRALEAARKFQP